MGSRSTLGGGEEEEERYVNMYSAADADDDFGFGETSASFTDNKKRNPTSGVDEAI